jgi:hypothetical protein
MLRAAKLPNRFWGLAVEYAVYLRNRLIKPGTGKTRYELLTGKSPSFTMVHEFGQEVAVLDPNDKKPKLRDRASAGIFVGVDAASNTYKVYLVKEKKIVRSRDVKFYHDHESDMSEKEDELTEKGENENEMSDRKESEIVPSSFVPAHIPLAAPVQRESDESDSDDELFDHTQISFSFPHTDQSRSPSPPPPFTVFIPSHEQSPLTDTSTSSSTNVSTRSREILGNPGTSDRQFWKDAMQSHIKSAIGSKGQHNPNPNFASDGPDSSRSPNKNFQSVPESVGRS